MVGEPVGRGRAKGPRGRQEGRKEERRAELRGNRKQKGNCWLVTLYTAQQHQARIISP